VKRKAGARKEVVCSFCGRSKEEVSRLVSGQNVYICSDCIKLCSTILEDDLKTQAVKPRRSPPKPPEIKDFLDRYVIGQEKAKRILAVAVYNHYKRIMSPPSKDDVEVEKSNVLLIGPTGTGKTLLAETLARFLKVPFAIVDATAFTEAGYVGEDVENILARLLQNADFNLAAAEKGIVYVDEIDKILKNSSKAELIERLDEELRETDKVIVVLITDKEDGRYTSQVMTLGIENTYEAYGILDVAKHDLQEDDLV